MRVLRLHPATLAATCLLLLAGCGGVALENPLSDEKTTEVDERLIGFWELEAESIEEDEPGPGQLWPQIAVGRKKGDARAMEAVMLDVEEGFVDVKRLEVRPTRIGDRRYLSLRNPEEEEHGWYVVRYRIGDDGRMHVRVLDEQACAKSVDEGQVEGEVRSPERGHEVVSLTVEIEATTAEARAWIEEHGDRLFTERAVTFRRLVERSLGGEEEVPDAPEPPVAPPGPDDEPESPGPGR